ncbi:MAG: cytochrome c biogenesis protein CcdA [Elusimicrobia bacterium]|nr:cytochrome c biogenesis protein CcdA [Elusimicrobiota bacterium]
MHSVSVTAAFLAGLASFLSPCVLPLVPGYISFMSGLSLEELASGEIQPGVTRRAALAAVFFVLGFSLVFTALGASASFVGHLLGAHQVLLSRIAGVLVIVFGLHMTGLVPIKWLYYTKRADTSKVGPGLLGSFLMGLAFAFGWTPCIGPILAGILALASTQETVAQGVGLLLVYSMGLGVPFILTGLGINAFLSFFARYKRFIRWGEIAAGVLLMALGVLILSNRMSWLMRLLPSPSPH